MSDEGSRVSHGANGVRGVVLDFGEVLCHRPNAKAVLRMAEALKLDLNAFTARYDRERGPYDRGDLAPEDYWLRVAGEGMRLEGGLLGKLRRWDVEMWSDMNPEMVDWLERLREAGYRTAVLSNMHPDMTSHARSTLPWLSRLDCAVLSSEIHLAKPEPAIYQHCLACLKLPPHQALFIDDREPNVAAARGAGLIGLRFESVVRLRADLPGLGIEVLP